MIAVAGQQLGHAGARNQLAGEHPIERRQRHGAIGNHLHRRAAMTEQQHRAKHGIDARADDQLLRVRPACHRLHREAGDARGGLRAAHAGEHLACRAAEFIGMAKVEGHAAQL